MELDTTLLYLNLVALFNRQKRTELKERANGCWPNQKLSKTLSTQRAKLKQKEETKGFFESEWIANSQHPCT